MLTTTTRRKNSEKRKEKSRFAARARRSRESEIFSEMGALLPLPQSIVSQVDKASTMRLAISFIRTRYLMEKYNLNDDLFKRIPEAHEVDILGPSGTIDAFLIVLTPDGHMPYISENVEKYLGLKQIDLLGLTMFEFSHPCDHNDIREALAHKYDREKSDDESLGKDHHHRCTSSFLIRLKCTITSKGKTINLKSAAYKVIKLTGHWIEDDTCGYLCLLGEPLACPTKIDGPLGDQIFLSRHSPDMKFTDIDERFTELLGYEQKDLIGKSVYNLFHALDCLNLSECFKTLFTKGQSETGYYRLLAKRGGYVWIQTQATLITDNHTQQPVSVVCVNYALSGIENCEEIISEDQCQERQRESYQFAIKTDNVVIKLATSSLIETKDHPDQQECQQQHLESIEAQQQTQSEPEQQHEQAYALAGVRINPSIPTVVTESLFTRLPLTTQELSPSQRQVRESLIDQVGQPINQGQQQQLLQPQPLQLAQAIQPTIQQVQAPLLTPLVGNSLPTPATTTIFAPRTADMNPGFLMPIGDDDNFGLTVLPDVEACDPDQDLTHLAPQAGDFCVPLEIGPLPTFDGFSMDDFLKEMGFTSGANGSNSANDAVKSNITSTAKNEVTVSSAKQTTATILSEVGATVNHLAVKASETLKSNQVTVNRTSDKISGTAMNLLTTPVPTTIVLGIGTYSNAGPSTPPTKTTTPSTPSTVVTSASTSNKETILVADIDEEEETLNFTDYLPSDSKLLPFIPAAVAEEEIQFSCDDECEVSETRNSIDTVNNSCVADDAIDDTNSLSDFLSNQRLIESTASVITKTQQSSIPATSPTTSTVASNSDSGDEDSPLCSPCSDGTNGSSGSGVAYNPITSSNLTVVTSAINAKHGITGSSPLNNDPFLSFTDGNLVTDNYLCSLSSSSSSNSPNFYGSSRLSTSPDFTLKRSSSSLCDSPPPSSCNSTLTRDLDLCGSFANEDEDDCFDGLTRSGQSGQSKRPLIERHYDDEFPLLTNDDSIWDTFIHSNISDMINSDDLLPSGGRFDDFRLLKDPLNCPLGVDTDGSNPGSSGSSSNGASDSDSFLLNSNLAMLLQGKDMPVKNGYAIVANSIRSAQQEQQEQQQQQQAAAIAAAAANRNRFHNYSANLLKTPSVDNRVNSNYVIVQNSRSIKTSSHSNVSNGTKDNIIKSAQANRQTCDLSKNEIGRKSEFIPIEAEMKKYRSMTDTVYSKLGPNYVKIAQKLAYNSSSSSMPSPKRAYLPSKNSSENNYKRMKLPSTLPSMQGTSVLMNLLVNGEDVTNGYSRFNSNHISKTAA